MYGIGKRRQFQPLAMDNHGGSAEAGPQFWIFDEARQRFGQGGDIAGLHQQAGFSVGDDVFDRAQPAW